MNEKELKKHNKGYKEALNKFKQERKDRDRMVHSEDSRIKYDYKTGTLIDKGK